jgi:biotin carboxyl carrier protein
MMEENELQVEYDNYETRLSRKFKNRKPYEAPNKKAIFSQLPGVIIEVHVKVGDQVKPKDPLYTLDAMKMHNLFKARRGGVVKEIHVEIGEMIPKNHLVIEYS